MPPNGILNLSHTGLYSLCVIPKIICFFAKQICRIQICCWIEKESNGVYCYFLQGCNDWRYNIGQKKTAICMRK